MIPIRSVCVERGWEPFYWGGGGVYIGKRRVPHLFTTRSSGQEKSHGHRLCARMKAMKVMTVAVARDVRQEYDRVVIV